MNKMIYNFIINTQVLKYLPFPCPLSLLAPMPLIPVLAPRTPALAPRSPVLSPRSPVLAPRTAPPRGPLRPLTARVPRPRLLPRVICLAACCWD